MKKIRIFNYLLIIIASIGGIILSYDSILDGNIYRTLIRLSIIPVMLLPKILNLFLKKKIDSYTETIYIVFVFSAHFLGSVYNLYYKWPGYDKLMHFISGIITSFLAVIILVKNGKYSKNIFFNIIFIISITMAIAGLWEFFEYICDNLFNRDAQRVMATGINDTMQDMIVAFLGSILFSIIYAFEETNNKKYLIKKYIEVINYGK